MVQGIGNVNNAIGSNREMFTKLTSQNRMSNKQHLINSYTLNQTQYYNDEAAIKKEEKKKKYKKLSLGFIGVGTLVLAGTILSQFAGKKINSKTWNEIAQNTANTELVKKGKEVFEKGANLITNVCHIKDDFWTRYTSKLDEVWKKHTNKDGIFEKINNKLEDLYHTFSKNKYQKKYEKSKEIIEKTFEGKKIDSFEDWFNGMKDPIKWDLGLVDNKDHERRITENLLKKNKDLPISQQAKEFWNTLTNSVIANDKLESTRQMVSEKGKIWFGEELPENLHSKNPEEAKKAFDKLCEVITDKTTGKTEKEIEEIANAVKDMDFIQKKGAQEIFDRTRDTVLGNASTDLILSVIMPLGLLCGAVQAAETKEDKKTTAIDLGIPILSSIGTTVFFTAKCFSGLYGMVLGGVAGTALTTSIKSAYNAITNTPKDKQENTNLKA